MLETVGEERQYNVKGKDTSLNTRLFFYCLGVILCCFATYAGLPHSTSLIILIAIGTAVTYWTRNPKGALPPGWAEFNVGGFTKLDLARIYVPY